MKTTALVIALAGALALGGTAQADIAPHTQPVKPVKERREERREKIKEKIADIKEKRDERRDKIKEKIAESDGGLKGAWKEWREKRKERREERVKELKEKWGDDVLKRPAVRAELKVHARRMARLHRIRALAKDEGKTAVVERVDKLIAKERSRHQKHMETLKTAPAEKAEEKKEGAE